ncbi:MAG: SAM-dependent methyltransferase [Dehalococcoidia bacterium]|nr:SAM-dependent methyltransferase [Dehalococcoidia bacterium]
MNPPEPPQNLVPIGVVRNGEFDAARQDWRGVRSRLELRADLEAALLGLADYSHVIVLGWLHEIPQDMRSRTQAYPSGDQRLPLQGALALRGGARPNPISVTVCRLRGVAGAILEVEGLDLIDGTPVLDVKPYIAFYDAEPKASLPKWARG